MPSVSSWLPLCWRGKAGRRGVDVTLPGRGIATGGLHPVTLTQQRIEVCFARWALPWQMVRKSKPTSMVSALNIPKDHPARAMQDTFYVENGVYCALTPRRSRSALHAQPFRADQDHCARAVSIGSIPTLRIRRCSARWKGCGSMKE